ncbi:MAG: bifunctional histidinol-phosphatase/imidazoleglycerol-phosphate dehydratase HisB [Bacteroidales bacterium]
MAKKVLFIDRDGTIIKEPPIDFQVDSLEKLEFIPGAITNLARLALLDFELVMVTNQDGLGTESFPENDFWGPHNKMMQILKGENAGFHDVFIDKSFPEEQQPTRKPGTAMLHKYTNNPEYNLSESYVIGDRITDIQLAKNLGCKGIFFQDYENGYEKIGEADLFDSCALITDSWDKIYQYIRNDDRVATIHRQTKETDISLTIDLDGNQTSHIATGLHFFDHMLDQIVHHAKISVNLQAKGDLHVDEHHLIEDVGIVFGKAVYEALGNKLGLERYGFALPMDESSAEVLIDFGGRISFEWDAKFTREKIGDVPCEMFKHFFKSFCEGAVCNLHIRACGENEHHKIEAIFKAFARALRMAIRRDPYSNYLPSSKGAL